MINTKDTIDQLIKRLEYIRDNNEIDEIIVEPLTEENSFEMWNGDVYVHLSDIITIKHKSLYKKGDLFDSYVYKPVNDKK